MVAHQSLPSNLETESVLSKDGSGKEIVHYEIDLGDSGIAYRAGDVVNIFPKMSQHMLMHC